MKQVLKLHTHQFFLSETIIWQKLNGKLPYACVITDYNRLIWGDLPSLLKCEALLKLALSVNPSVRLSFRIRRLAPGTLTQPRPALENSRNLSSNLSSQHANSPSLSLSYFSLLFLTFPTLTLLFPTFPYFSLLFLLFLT